MNIIINKAYNFFAERSRKIPRISPKIPKYPQPQLKDTILIRKTQFFIRKFRIKIFGLSFRIKKFNIRKISGDFFIPETWDFFGSSFFYPGDSEFFEFWYFYFGDRDSSSEG